MNTDREKIILIEKSKNASLKDAAFANAASGAGESYISAYAVALNFTASEIGLLSALPSFLAPLSQLLTSRIMGRFSRKKIANFGILFQALVWVPISLIGIFLKHIPFAPSLLVFFYIIYAFWGNFITPAWSSWIGDLVSQKDINYFLGRRSRIGSIAGFIGTIFSGIILEFFRKESVASGSNLPLFFGFGLIFMSAMILRLISRYYLKKQYEPEFRFKKESYFSFFDFLKEAPKRPYGIFAIFIAFMVLSTNIVAPYYSIYLLRNLHFSYFSYMLMQVSTILAIFIYTPLWSIFSDRYGHTRTLRITSHMIPILCFLWPISLLVPNPFKLYFLLLTNFFAGLSWSGFNLTAGSYLYYASSPEKRSLCAAYSNILNGISTVIGVILGGLIIAHLPIHFMNQIMFVSIISGVARLSVSLALIPRLKEVRPISEKPTWQELPFISHAMDLPHSIFGLFSVDFIRNTIPKKRPPKKDNQEKAV